jgi:D-2-hydroxyacid dehydrogenase (NADP+)
MRVLVYLSSEVGAFGASEVQVARLADRLPGHQFRRVASKEELMAGLPEADAVIVWSFPAKWYEQAPRLRHVFTPSAGRERIQPDPREKVELHFGRFQGTLMAESLLGMMLFLNRQVGVMLANQRAHVWDARLNERGRRLSEQTALIVGYGTIGRQVAEVLSRMGMTIHGLKRDVRRGGEGAERLFRPEELHRALALADHVVCILPSDTGTDRLLDAAAIACMKRGAFVYNLGRGNAIDHDALAGALRSRALGGAFLDVWPEEPLRVDSPLWDVPGLYLSPHVSAVYHDYLDLHFEELAQELERSERRPGARNVRTAPSRSRRARGSRAGARPRSPRTSRPPGTR